MRKFRTFLTRRAIVRATTLALPLAAVTALPACDLFNQAKAAVQNAAQIPIDQMESTKVTLDLTQVIGAAAGQTTPQDLNQEITTPASPLDLNKTQPEITKYANGHIVTLEINKIGVTPTTNTLTGDMPALDLYIGAVDAKDTSTAIKVATIPAIKAGSTAAFDAQIDTAAMTKAGTTYLSKLAFSQMMHTKLTVKAGDKVPGGKVDLKLDLGLHAVVTPL